MCFVNFKLIILSFLFLACFDHLKASDEESDDFEEAKSQQLNESYKSGNDLTSINSSTRRRTISADTILAIKPFNTYQVDCRALFNSYCSNKLFCGDDEDTKSALTSLMDEVFSAYGAAKLELLLNEISSHRIEDRESVTAFEQWFEEHKQELLSRT